MNEKIVAPRLELFVDINRFEGLDANIENVVEFAAEGCNDVIDSVKTLECVDEALTVLESPSGLVNLEDDVLEQEYTQEQIFQRRQELLQKRKRFVQIVLDAIYVQYQTDIDALIALEPRWQSLLDSNFERVKRWGTARFIKQIVRDNEMLTKLLKIKVDIDGSKKAIKNLPYIKSFLARCRVGEDRLIGGGSLKGDENGEIAARRFQKIKDALEDFRIEVFKDYKIVDGKKKLYERTVNGKKISVKNKLKNNNLRTQIVASLDSISDLESFRYWLETNFSLEQVSIKDSDENILFCVFVSSLRKIVGRKMLYTNIDKIELYKSLFNARFVPTFIYNSPLEVHALDTTFIEFRDSLWESYFNTPDFFTKYPSYYFWLKDSPEADGLKKNNLGDLWGMIPNEFRGKNKWSMINMSFKDADKLHKVFEEVQNSWNGDDEEKDEFFTKYPSYYFWFKYAPEAKSLEMSNLGYLWGMIPDEFRGKNKWSRIGLPFKDADKLHNAFEEVQNSWNGNDEEKDEFFTKYSSYYFWFKYAPEAESLNKSHLGEVWGMIPDEFRVHWSKIALPFKDADKLHTEILEDSKTWINGDSKAYLQHFAQIKLNWAFYWGLIPTSLRQKFNLKYYHPGKIDYNGIKVDSKQEFAVLRVFEEVLGYKPEVGVNFQVEVDSNRRNTFDFKIEYQEEDSHVTHFFEWHPVVVSFNGGRNDAGTLDEYQDIVELIDDDYLSDCDLYAYAQELAEQDYYNERLELLTNETAHNFQHDVQGDVRLTCVTAGDSTGGLTKNLETLHGFLQQAKPDLKLTLAQLTSMFKGYLNDAMDYEVESVEGVN